MTKKVKKPRDYSIIQKVGVDNKEPVKNLMEQIYGNKEDHDFNKMFSGMISVIEENNLTDKVKHQVVIAPKKKTLSLKEIQLEALKKEVSQLRKEVN
jgi:predicted DNA binding CopG/RHH family protein